MIEKTVNAISRQAGFQLAEAYPGPGKDKRIAADLGISPGMARVLRAGRGWTVQRLGQCAERFGLFFIRDVFAPALGQQQLDLWLLDIEKRLQALERERGDVEKRDVLPDGEDRERPPGAPSTQSRARARAGAPARGKSQVLARPRTPARTPDC